LLKGILVRPQTLPRGRAIALFVTLALSPVLALTPGSSAPALAGSTLLGTTQTRPGPVKTVLGAAIPVGTTPARPVRYQPPVGGPITDPWRAPTSPYGPGNRGVDYNTPVGTPVLAAAAGTVTFAGPVAGTLYVVIAHADGIRTTLGGLSGISVRVGQTVSAGEVVGQAGGSLHFGARRGTEYLDPTTLFRRGPARLVARSG
jgi:murein DD-endopeptidase MepM/ murein hydrolase activator NlpD